MYVCIYLSVYLSLGFYSFTLLAINKQTYSFRMKHRCDRQFSELYSMSTELPLGSIPFIFVASTASQNLISLSLSWVGPALISTVMANHDKHYSLKQHKSMSYSSAGRVQHKPDGIRSAFLDGDSRTLFVCLFVFTRT